MGELTEPNRLCLPQSLPCRIHGLPLSVSACLPPSFPSSPLLCRPPSPTLLYPPAAPAGKDFLTATSEVSDKFYGFRDVSLGVLQAHVKMEEAVQALQVDKVFDFVKEVGKIKDAITPAFEPLKVIGDIFAGIADVLQYIK